MGGLAVATALVLARNAPMAAPVDGLDLVQGTLAEAETVFAAITLPRDRDPVAGAMHAEGRAKVLLRVDASGWVIDAGPKVRMHYDGMEQVLHYDGGDGPQLLSAEATAAAAGVFAALRDGFASWGVTPAPAELLAHLPRRARETWFEAAPGAAWAEDLEVLISAHADTGAIRRFAVVDPQGRPYRWRGAALVGSVDQLDLNIALEGDRDSPVARPFFEHGTPAAWRTDPIRDGDDRVYHEGLEQLSLQLDPSLGQPTPTPAPAAIAQWLDASCEAAGELVPETRTFVWDVDAADPALASARAALGQGCTLAVAAGVGLVGDLNAAMEGSVLITARALDRAPPTPVVHWEEAVVFAAGPGRTLDHQVLTWTLEPALDVADLRFEIEATLQGACAATDLGPSVLRAEILGLDQPEVTWTCP